MHLLDRAHSRAIGSRDTNKNTHKHTHSGAEVLLHDSRFRVVAPPVFTLAGTCERSDSRACIGFITASSGVCVCVFFVLECSSAISAIWRFAGGFFFYFGESERPLNCWPGPDDKLAAAEERVSARRARRADKITIDILVE